MRNSYSTIINLMGPEIFDLVRDHHNQRDKVGEAEAARVEDMIKKIKNAHLR
jgi:hypothetical protein